MLNQSCGWLQRGFGKSVLPALLFVVCFARLLAHAPYVPLFADEQSGIAESFDFSYSQLLTRGPLEELNPSPLHYLVDKAWIGFAGGAPHRKWNLEIFFRVPPVFFFALAAVFFSAIFARLARQRFPRAGFAADLFGFACGFAFSSCFQTMRMAALWDRPYSLWIFLIVLQFWLLGRELGGRRNSRWAWALCHLAMTLTTFAAAVQVCATQAYRLWFLRSELRKNAVPLALESLPSIAAALWFWHFTVSWPPIEDPFPSFVQFWLKTIALGTWNPPWAIFDVAHLGFQYGATPPFAVALCGVFLVLPFFRPQPLHYFCLLALAGAVVVTRACQLAGNQLEERYFHFVYPYFLAMPGFALLAVASPLSRAGAWAQRAVLIMFFAAQLWFRVPALIFDVQSTMAAKPNFPLWANQAAPICPESLGAFRADSKRSIDIRRLQSACLLGTDPGPPALAPAQPGSQPKN